jgi:poly-gamma-glutamate synthesis protein (capsule biosynthesis protein)
VARCGLCRCDDYEDIRGYEAFRDDLVLMYFPIIRAPNGTLAGLDMVPLQIRSMCLRYVSPADATWLADTLSQERLGSRVRVAGDRVLRLALD